MLCFVVAKREDEERKRERKKGRTSEAHETVRGKLRGFTNNTTVTTKEGFFQPVTVRPF